MPAVLFALVEVVVVVVPRVLAVPRAPVVQRALVLAVVELACGGAGARGAGRAEGRPTGGVARGA